MSLNLDLWQSAKTFSEPLDLSKQYVHCTESSKNVLNLHHAQLNRHLAFGGNHGSLRFRISAGLRWKS